MNTSPIQARIPISTAARAVPLPGGRRLRVVPVPAAARARCLAAVSPTGPNDAALVSAPAISRSTERNAIHIADT